MGECVGTIITARVGVGCVQFGCRLGWRRLSQKVESDTVFIVSGFAGPASSIFVVVGCTISFGNYGKGGE